MPGAKGGWVLVSDAIKKPLPDAAPFPGGLRRGAQPATESEAEAAAEGGDEAPAEKKDKE